MSTTRLSPHVTCDHGNFELFCDTCDLLNHGRRTVTPWLASERDQGTHWLTPHQDRQLRDTLTNLPDMLTQAHAVINGERLGGTDNTSHPVPGSRPPLTIATLDLLRVSPPAEDPIARITAEAGILTCLHSWARLAHGELCDLHADQPTRHPEPRHYERTVWVATTRGVTDYAPPTVPSLTRWLLHHIVWITEQQWVTEFAEDMHTLDRGLRAALKQRADYHPRCPQCREHVEQFTGYFECANGHQTEARHLMALQNPMTSDQLADAFDVTSEAIRQWVSRGHLTPALDSNGNVLKSGKAHRYHVTDVLRLIDTTPRKAG